MFIFVNQVLTLVAAKTVFKSTYKVSEPPFYANFSAD